MILLKIAFRNLLAHKGKTLIIGVLIALGVVFLVVGNSVALSAAQGMQRSFNQNFTGDVILRNVSERPVSFIGGFGVTPPLEDYTATETFLAAQADVLVYTPLLTGGAVISKDDRTLGFAPLWGVHPSRYQATFPNTFEITSGEPLQDGETGIVLSQELVEDIYESEGVRLEPGDTLLLSGQNDVTGSKIREVTVRGIGSFVNSVGLIGTLSFVDPTTLRTLTGLTAARTDRVAARAEAAPPPTEDALFGSSELLTESAADNAQSAGAAEAIDFDTILGDTSVREQFLSVDNSAWHFIVLRTTDSASLEELRAELNEAGLDSVVAESWRWGAGVLAGLVDGVRTLLNVTVAVIAVVSVIIIMNTLVISVTERVAEIGTVRALGAQRSFVRGMIALEVLTISLVFGLIGVALGSLIVGVLNLIGLPASNVFLQTLFGGAELKPVLSLFSLAASLVAVTVIGVLASLYPAAVALGITPVQAMGRR